MTIHNKGKLNQLTRILPEGLLVDAAWLEKRGYSRSLRSQYVAADWLYQPCRGVYRRGNTPLTWQQVFVSLHTLLEYPVSVGGLSALQQQGFAHYLPQAQKSIHLFSDQSLPTWLAKLPLETTFITHNRHRFLPAIKTDVALHPHMAELEKVSSKPMQSAIGLRASTWGEWNWPIVMSKPERAILELLDELPKRESFHNIDAVMEGLVNISPSRMQSLLEKTSSI
ncbi:MAG: AbiEi antitoxin N-terminal domain-containing protein, partial [Pseudohongiellaceae bacterium]